MSADGLLANVFAEVVSLQQLRGWQGAVRLLGYERRGDTVTLVLERCDADLRKWMKQRQQQQEEEEARQGEGVEAEAGAVAALSVRQTAEGAEGLTAAAGQGEGQGGEVCEVDGWLRLEEVLEMWTQAAGLVQQLHSRHIAHCDIKVSV